MSGEIQSEKRLSEKCGKRKVVFATTSGRGKVQKIEKRESKRV